MKKLVVTFLASALIFGATGISNAALATFTETFLGTPTDSNKIDINSFSLLSLININETAYFHFDITSAGNSSSNYAQLTLWGAGVGTAQMPTSDANTPQFNSSNYVIDSAFLSYTLSDNDNLSDKFTINTGSNDGNAVIASFTGSNNVIGRGKSVTYSYDLKDFFSYLYDGKFDLGITATNGTNITAEQVQLVVNAHTIPVPAPLPAAALLLASGLIGLIGVKRRQPA